jgi:hypothetical protein
MKLIPLTQGQFAKVDDEDYERVNKFRWCANWMNGKSFYAIHSYRRDNGTHTGMSMHRLVMGAKNGQNVDHIHHDTLDNRKSELRICTQSQNLMNKGKSRNNTSGFKGVSWRKDCKKWIALIRKENKTYNLGYFSTKEEAAIAYDQKAKELHGEFAFLNFI